MVKAAQGWENLQCTGGHLMILLSYKKAYETYSMMYGGES